MNNNTQHFVASIGAPLLALWRWLMARPGSAQHFASAGTPLHNTPQFHSAPVHLPLPGSMQSTASVSAQHTLHAGLSRTIRPLRVLQVVEAGQNPGHGARLRISGRMADVCAELDRLAAREALLH